jgi:hypothetical protein
MDKQPEAAPQIAVADNWTNCRREHALLMSGQIMPVKSTLHKRNVTRSKTLTFPEYRGEAFFAPMNLIEERGIHAAWRSQREKPVKRPECRAPVQRLKARFFREFLTPTLSRLGGGTLGLFF